MLGVALALAWFAVRPHLLVSWTPADEGVLAQSAERVMRGEVPHRDFVALWSGGLDYFNAAAFRVLGTRLASLRAVLAAAWLLSLAAMFAAARHMLAPLWAGALVLCAALWTLPLSPHPLPSWYNLFLALGGVAAVLQWMRSRRRAWLVVAGAAAGASVAVKIVGLYFVAAVLLGFVWEVQSAVMPGPAARHSAARPYAWMVTTGLLVFLVLVARLVLNELSVNTGLHFVVPAALLVAALLWREWRLPGGSERARLAAFASLAGPFAAGAAIVCALWLTPYLRGDGLAMLARGLFVTPQERFLVATYPLPGLRSAGLAALPFAVLLAAAPFARQPLRRADHLALAGLVALLVALSYDGSPLVLLTWYGLRLLTPVCTALAVWWLLVPPRAMPVAPERAGRAFFLVAVAATASLIQVPFALYTYFLYSVPLLALAVAALATAPPAMPAAVPGSLLAFVLLFGARGPDSLPRRSDSRQQDALVPLGLPRGGLIVSREDSTTYGALIGSIARHAPGEWMYVWHDAPQLYFLSGRRNPTRTMFEVFDDPRASAPDSLTQALRRRDVRLVVLTDPAGALRPMDPAFRTWLVSAYPESEQVERYEVRWRTGPLGVR